MKKISIQYYKSPVGEMIIGDFQNKLCLCDWRYRKMRTQIDTRIQKGLNAEYELSDSTIIQSTISQLNEYFNKERKQFELELLLVGTDFQKKVWEQLLKVPFGKKETYSGLAKKLKNEAAIRAVAAANGANAISIIVPCHRIVGKNGELVGYAGGLEAKKKLLNLENENWPTQLELFSSV